MNEDETQGQIDNFVDSYLERRWRRKKAGGGFMELMMAMGAGLVHGARGLPAEAIAVGTGRATSPERAEQYGLEEYEGFLPTVSEAAQSAYTPRTEEGKIVAEAVRPVAHTVDDFIRWLARLPGRATSWVPGEHPEIAHGTEQTAYTYLNLLNPLKYIRGSWNMGTRGPSDVWGRDVYLMRGPRAGTRAGGPSWYRGGQKLQLAKMVPEVIASKHLNLNPKNAYVSEFVGIPPLIARELKRLEGVMDAHKIKSQKHQESFNQYLEPRVQSLMDEGMTRQKARKVANEELKIEGTKAGDIWESKKRADKVTATASNEYFNEIAKTIVSLKASNPSHKALKNLESALEGYIFPTSFRSMYGDIVNNPQILSDLTKSDFPLEMLEHVVPRLKTHTKEGIETLWLTKPLLPKGGHTVRASASVSKVKNGLQNNPLLMLDKAWESIWTRNPDAIITKDLLLQEMRDMNAKGGGKAAKFDIDLADRRIMESDKYISVGPHTSRTSDRLLAHMNHTRVFDKSTGHGVQWNTDHYQLGSGNKTVDAALTYGRKSTPVVIDVTNIAIGRPKKGKDVDFKVVTAGQIQKKTPKGKTDMDVIIEEINAMMDADPPPGWIAGRTAETVSWPASSVARESVQLEEKRKKRENSQTRNIY